jgi:hypothetical protein
MAPFGGPTGVPDTETVKPSDNPLQAFTVMTCVTVTDPAVNGFGDTLLMRSVFCAPLKLTISTDDNPLLVSRYVNSKLVFAQAEDGTTVKRSEHPVAVPLTKQLEIDT